MAESANGTVLPTAASIEDGDGAIWTLRDIDGAVLKDGVDTGIVNVMEVWYLANTVNAFKGARWRRYDADLLRWRNVRITSSDMPDAIDNIGGLRAPVGPQLLASHAGVQCNPGDDLNQIAFDNPPGTTFVLAIGTYVQQYIPALKPGQRFIGLHDGVNGAVLDGEETTQYSFGGTGGHNVFHNLYIKDYTNGFQQGTIQVVGSHNRISNCEISGSLGSGVYCFEYLLILSCVIHHHGYEAYNCSSLVGVLFDNNELHTNNPTHQAGDTGGGKSSDTQDITFWYNWTHDNWGSGFWSDYANTRTNYWRNEIGPGNSNGIEIEISFNTQVMHNYIHDIGIGEAGAGGFFSCAAVAIENSGGSYGGGRPGDAPGIIEIAYNLVVLGDYSRAVAGRQQARGIAAQYSTGNPYWIANVHVHHNTFDWSGMVNSFTDALHGFVQDTGDTSIWYNNNIVVDYNTYVVGDFPFKFAWNNHFNLNFLQWQSFGLDVHGSVTDAPALSSARWSTAVADHTDPGAPSHEYVRVSHDGLIAQQIEGAYNVQGIATVSVTSGQKRYWELFILESEGGFNGVNVGVCNASNDFLFGNWLGLSANSLSYTPTAGVYTGGSSIGTLTGFARGSIIGIACHGGNKIWFRTNGVWSDDPAAGTGGFDISGLGTVSPAYGLYGGKIFGNFGGEFFSAPPTGFTAFT